MIGTDRWDPGPVQLAWKVKASLGRLAYLVRSHMSHMVLIIASYWHIASAFWVATFSEFHRRHRQAEQHTAKFRRCFAFCYGMDNYTGRTFQQAPGTLFSNLADLTVFTVISCHTPHPYFCEIELPTFQPVHTITESPMKADWNFHAPDAPASYARNGASAHSMILILYPRSFASQLTRPKMRLSLFCWQRERHKGLQKQDVLWTSSPITRCYSYEGGQVLLGIRQRLNSPTCIIEQKVRSEE